MSSFDSMMHECHFKYDRNISVHCPLFKGAPEVEVCFLISSSACRDNQYHLAMPRLKRILFCGRNTILEAHDLFFFIGLYLIKS